MRLPIRPRKKTVAQLVEAVRRATRNRPTRGLIVAASGVAVPSAHGRVGVFAVRGEDELRVPRLLVEAQVLARDVPTLLDELAARVGACRRGGWDVGWASGWRRLWSADLASFTVWGRSRWAAHLRGAELRTRKVSIPVAAVRAVTAYTSRDLRTHGVRVDCLDGRQVPVIDKHEWLAELDPTYGGLEVLADMSWCVRLASDLATAIVPYNPAVIAWDTFLDSRIVDERAMTALERTVVSALLAELQAEGTGPTEALHLDSVRVLERSFTGVGCFVDFERCVATKLFADDRALTWPGAVTVELNDDRVLSGYLAYVRDGYLEAIEGHVYGDAVWPRQIARFQVVTPVRRA